MKKLKKLKYDDSSIKDLKGLEPVKRKPGMFVGDVTTQQGIFQCIKEIVDNALDEYLAGFCNRINIVLDADKDEIAVMDNGRGIPQKSIVRVYTTLHSGGKFDHDSYKVSAGLHGVGCSCTNALSDRLTCCSIRKNRIVQADFKKGIVVEQEHKVKRLPKNETLRKAYTKTKKGTVVWFKPDWTILKYGKIPVNKIKDWLKVLELLCPELKMSLTVVHKNKESVTTYYSKHGIKGLANNQDFYFKNDLLECLIKFFPESNSATIDSYVNTIPINEGTHINAFWRSIKSSVTIHAKKANPKVTSLRELVYGMIHIKASDPIFIGQTKEKLGDEKIEKQINEVLTEELSKFFSKKKKVALQLIKQSLMIENFDKDRKAKIEALKNRDKEIRSGKLPVGLAVSLTKNSDERELFIVEGDSAGGSAKQGRNKKYQEILPLGGKPSNVEQLKIEEALKDIRIRDVILSIGGDDPSKGRVGKVFFLADADPDGSHITSLLITAFIKLFPDWVSSGKVYYVKAPLFHTIHKNKRYFGNTAKEVLKQTKVKCNVMRVKGWGEMRPDDLSYVALDPETRVVEKIKVDTKSIQKALQIMGKDVSVRKNLLGI